MCIQVTDYQVKDVEYTLYVHVHTQNMYAYTDIVAMFNYVIMM